MAFRNAVKEDIQGSIPLRWHSYATSQDTTYLIGYGTDPLNSPVHVSEDGFGYFAITFKSPVRLSHVMVGPSAACNFTPAAWSVSTYDSISYGNIVNEQDVPFTTGAKSTQRGLWQQLSKTIETSHLLIRLHPGPPGTQTHGTADYLRFWIDSLPNRVFGTGVAKITLTGKGTSWAATRHYATGTGGISFTTTGHSWSIERAFHFPRGRQSAPARIESASNRRSFHLYLARIPAQISVAKNPRGDARRQPVKIATAFNASRVHRARARLRVRLGMWGREGSQAYLETFLYVENTGFLHTHVESFAQPVQLDLHVDASLTYQVGNSQPMGIKFRIAGPRGYTPLEGEVLPSYENRLRTRLWLWPLPEAYPIKQGAPELMPVQFGMETEHRPYMLAQAEPLEINLLDGRWRQARSVDSDGAEREWWWFDHDWDGDIYPAAQLAVGRIRLRLVARGRHTQYGEIDSAKKSVDLDMTASHYPWGKAVLRFTNDLWAKSKATHFGRWKPLVRMDYINFTGKVTGFGKLRRELDVQFFTDFGGIEDAVLGRAKRQLVRLLFRPRGAYVIRVMHPRPVQILHVATEPTHVHHIARSEGI